MRGIITEVFATLSLIFLDDIHMTIRVKVRILGWRVWCEDLKCLCDSGDVSADKLIQGEGLS